MFFCFGFSIDLTQEDTYIMEDSFNFQFVLRLQQQHFDTVAEKVEDINSPEKMKIQQSVRKAGGVSKINGGGIFILIMLVIVGTDSNKPTGSIQNSPNRTPGGTPNIFF